MKHGTLKVIGRLGLAVVAALVVGSCYLPGGGGAGPGGEAQSGSIHLSLAALMARSIQPPIPAQIVDFAVSGVGPAGVNLPGEPVILTGSGGTVDGLVPGAWAITVVGRNEGGVSLGQGGAAVTVVAGLMVPVTVLVEEYTQPPGGFSFDAAWQAGVVVRQPWVRSVLRDSVGQEDYELSGWAGEQSSGQQFITLGHEDLHPGWWTWQVRVYDALQIGLDAVEPVLVGGRAEAVRVLAGYTSVADVWIQAVDPYGEIELILDTDMHGDLALTASPPFSDIESIRPPLPLDESSWVALQPGESMDFSVSALTEPGVINAAFYLQGEQVQLGGSTFTLEADDLQEGRPYVLDVVAFSADHKRAASASWIVAVEEPLPAVPVTGVSLRPSTGSLEQGQTQQLVATVSPPNANNQTVAWSSDDTDVATVTASGLVTAVGTGAAVITVTTEDGGLTAECIVGVENAWTVQTIDGPLGSLRHLTSIGLDSSNHVHISYYDDSVSGGKSLKYATNATGMWQAEVVDGGAEGARAGLFSSLAVGLDGSSIHISYHHGRGGGEEPGLKYARKSAVDEWQTEWVDQREPNISTNSNWGRFGVIGIVPSPSDSEGEVHFLYQNMSGQYRSQRHKAGSSGNWTDFLPPHTDAYTTDTLSMDVRAVGGGGYELHVIYPVSLAWNSYELRYSCYSSSTESWSPPEVVAITAGAPYIGSAKNHDIAVDDDGNVHVCCFDPQRGIRNLFYQFRDAGGAWLVQPDERIWVGPDATEYVGRYCAIALDSTGRPHISYLDQRSAGGVMHATRHRNDSTVWVVERVTDQDGVYVSIALDGHDDIHISYIGGGDLRYATNR